MSRSQLSLPTQNTGFGLSSMQLVLLWSLLFMDSVVSFGTNYKSEGHPHTRRRTSAAANYSAFRLSY